MRISTSTRDPGQFSSLQVNGELDLDVCPELAEALAQFDATGDCLLLDMSNVSFMDSSPIGLLIRLNTEVVERGGALVVVCREPGVRRVFEISGLTTVLPVFDDYDAGAAYLTETCAEDAVR